MNLPLFEAGVDTSLLARAKSSQDSTCVRMCNSRCQSISVSRRLLCPYDYIAAELMFERHGGARKPPMKLIRTQRLRELLHTPRPAMHALTRANAVGGTREYLGR